MKQKVYIAFNKELDFMGVFSTPQKAMSFLPQRGDGPVMVEEYSLDEETFLLGEIFSKQKEKWVHIQAF